MTEQTNQTNSELLTTEDSHANAVYTVKYDGKEVQMPIDELLVTAQKGMNYDRVVSQRDRLRNEVASLRPVADSVHDGFVELFTRYPDLNSVPDGIIEQVAAGATPLEAYRDHLSKELALEIEALKTRERNSAGSPGSMRDDAPVTVGDDFVTGLFGRG